MIYLRKFYNNNIFILFRSSKRIHITSNRKCTCIKILGIETSCDDTGVAVINNAGSILGESLYSQNVFHLRYGGINPIVAHELHRDNIELAVSEAMQKSNLNWKDIHAIAVTVKPGLLLSLQVGVKYANYLARRHKKQLIPIHHMEAHALVARMYYNIPFPFITLLISGGHSLLAVAKDVDDFLLLGHSLDNAPGEVMDKAARRMKLKNLPEYSKLPGGYAIELASRKSRDPNYFDFPMPLVRARDCNFSFSGLKDSLVRKLLKKEKEHGIRGDGVIPEVNDLSASFLLAIAEHLAHRTERAIHFCEKKNIISSINKNIVVSGGVASNDLIFKGLQVVGEKLGYKIYRPPSKVCIDNGVMIAWNGIEKIEKGRNSMAHIDLKTLDPDSALGNSIVNEVITANIPVRVTRLKSLIEL